MERERDYTEWLERVILNENRMIGPINFVFVSDEDLLQMNSKYLDHDYYTDILSFDYSEKHEISGDIFISVDRVKENASLYKVDCVDEIRRVMVHGVLHLLGYKDESKEDKREMREKENKNLKMFHVEQ